MGLTATTKPFPFTIKAPFIIKELFRVKHLSMPIMIGRGVGKCVCVCEVEGGGGVGRPPCFWEKFIRLLYKVIGQRSVQKEPF